MSAWVCTSNFGGGLVAGDEVSIEIHAGAGTRGYLGTQSSTKVYWSPDGRVSRFHLHASLARDAVLIVAPDHVQCFAGARYEQRQEFHLQSGAGLVLVDWLSSGRVARGERWAFARYRSRIDVFCGDDHLLADSLLLDPADGLLAGAPRMGRCECLALVVFIGEPLRAAWERLLAQIAAEPVPRNGAFMCAAGPIRNGALLRVAGAGTEEVARFVHRHISIMSGFLGGDPWERKW
jgi:urease accessory protein